MDTSDWPIKIIIAVVAAVIAITLLGFAVDPSNQVNNKLDSIQTGVTTINTTTTTTDGKVDDVEEHQEDDVGPQTRDSAITATVRVSQNGDGTDGLTWATAYTTLPAALNAASADPDDLTLILLAPSTTNYDINTAGDPTWSKNVEILGSHRNWANITNTHVGATSILKFTGRVSLEDVTIDMGAGSLNGVIIDGTGASGARVRKVYFEAENVTGAQTCLELSGGVEYVRIDEVKFHGVVAHTRALYLNGCTLANFEFLDFHECATGIQFVGASHDNIWSFILLHDCTLGLDIDSGNAQFFHQISFSGNTRTIDDEVGNHVWIILFGAFDIEVLPDNLVGVTVSTGGGGVYGADTELLSAVSRDNPFRVVGYAFEPSTNEWYTVRFSDDAGTTFFDMSQFDGNKKEGASAPSGTEHIFNRATRISASARDISGGDNVKVWLLVQEY